MSTSPWHFGFGSGMSGAVAFCIQQPLQAAPEGFESVGHVAVSNDVVTMSDNEIIEYEAFIEFPKQISAMFDEKANTMLALHGHVSTMALDAFVKALCIPAFQPDDLPTCAIDSSSRQGMRDHIGRLLNNHAENILR